ncbi:MAG: TolC family protein [Salibacteraceae bacterium]|mgnify:CR=1 FL=1
MIRHLLLSCLCLVSGYLAAQPITLTLEDVVAIAQERSPEAQRAKNTYENRYWAFKTFKARQLPQLVFDGTVPSFNRSLVSSNTGLDGNESFVLGQSLDLSGSLRMNQNIGLTGGTIGLSTDLSRRENFGDSPSLVFQPNILNLNYSQPIGGFNAFRWDNRLEPMRMEESTREYQANMEDVARQASELFFTLLLAQKNFEIAQDNLATNDTLYQIAQGRYNLGKIAENDLLQLELTVMNSRGSLTQAEIDTEQANLALAIFLGLTGKEDLQLEVPSEIPRFEVDPKMALEKALENRADVISFERQLIEAQRDMAQAKANNRPSMDLSGSVGLQSVAPTVNEAYSQPDNLQTLRLTVSVPLVTWGQNKASMMTAQANQELVNLNVQQQQLNFQQEIMLLARQFELRRQSVDIAIRADTIAVRRYQITEKRYKVGKIDILDLNVALQERINARQDYIRSLRTFWSTYYELRQKTLFDFKFNQTIFYETDL